MKASVLGSGCIDPRILDLGTSWSWVVSFTPRPLYHQRKSPPYPLDKRLGGPQKRSGQRLLLLLLLLFYHPIHLRELHSLPPLTRYYVLVWMQLCSRHFQCNLARRATLQIFLTNGDFLLPCHTVATWTIVPQTWRKLFVQRISYVIAGVLPVYPSHGVNAFVSCNKINAINWNWLICPSF
jgi:hypothetical protein